MTQNPHIYDSSRTLSVKLPSDVSAKLATYRREMHPTMTDEEVAAYLIRDSLERLGLLDLPAEESGGNINQTPHVAGEGLMDTINRLPNAAQADPAFWDPIMSRMRYGASTPSAPQPPSPTLPDDQGKA